MKKLFLIMSILLIFCFLSLFGSQQKVNISNNDALEICLDTFSDDFIVVSSTVSASDDNGFIVHLSGEEKEADLYVNRKGIVISRVIYEIEENVDILDTVACESTNDSEESVEQKINPYKPSYDTAFFNSLCAVALCDSDVSEPVFTENSDDTFMVTYSTSTGNMITAFSDQNGNIIDLYEEHIFE